MKKFITVAILLILIDLTFHQCANPGRPTGGPKDTIPPTLIYSLPINGQTEYKSRIIELEFDEYINADKLKQQLTITPETKIQYKAIAKRNRLIIQLEGDLEDSTTYNFNFANGITDITEKNPSINLSIAFSTGTFIDSLSVEGSIQELLSQENQKGYLVGIYPYTDTLDFFTQRPMYFSTTNDSGKYNIDYIKRGIYKILAFDDDNGNFLLDPENEAHGFIGDTIQLLTKRELKTIPTVLQNVKPIELINTRPVGPYVEVKFNKSPYQYSIDSIDMYHQLAGDNKDVIRLYKPTNINYQDSITTNITVSDSLGNTITREIRFVFLESNRKKSSFQQAINPDKIDIQDTNKIKINFNKPIKLAEVVNASIQEDSTFEYPVTSYLEWNENKTSLDLLLSYSADSLYRKYQQKLKMDSINRDTSNIDQELKKNTRASIRNNEQLALIIPQSSFISVENDSSKTIKIPVRQSIKKSTGELLLTVQTDKSHFKIQILNKKGKVAYNIADQTEINLSEIEAGTYSIRVLIDNNKDGKWSYGNLLMGSEPESLYLYPEEISIRENWNIEMGITF